MVVVNHGQVPVPYTLILYAKGEVVSPRIENIRTGETLAILKTMTAGERIILEITHQRTYVTSSLEGDIRGALDLDSSLFRLGVGDNVLKPGAEAGLDLLEMELRFAPEITGVWV